MIITDLRGGLGNQMFQYAAGKSLAEKSGQALKISYNFLQRTHNYKVTPRNYELGLMNVKANVASSWEVMRLRNLGTRALKKLLPDFDSNPYVREKKVSFDASILELKGTRFLEGHWMSEKYFLHIESLIRQEFTFKNALNPTLEELRIKIRATESVCIQVRRGDYVTNPKVAILHQTTSLEYFKTAIELMKEKIANPVFFVFSDDPQWCALNFDDLPEVHFIELECPNALPGDYLQLMISCKYFIISNSTFGWWAAWLSSFFNKIVIAPKKWLNDDAVKTEDIYPSLWIQL